MSALTAEQGTRPDGRVPFAYERISRFTVQGTDINITKGVDRQAQDNDEAAALRQMGPVTHLQDDGISASRFGTKTRDGWQELLQAIRSDQVSQVLIWSLDRIVRQTRDMDDLLDLCRAHGVTILQTSSGTVIDPNNPDSVGMAKVGGVFAEVEAAKMSMRQKRKHAALAESGSFHGGPRRFGYDSLMTELVPDEAAAVRKVVDDLLAGGSLGSSARYLNEQGLKGSRGGAWTGGNLRTMLLRPHLAKLRVRKDGEPIEATWAAPAILTVQEHEALTAILGDPSRRTNPGPNTRRHLLVGELMSCGECGARIRSATQPSSDGKRVPVYRCSDPATHVSRGMEQVNAIVTTAVIDRLKKMSPDGLLVSPENDLRLRAIDDEQEALRARLRRAQLDYDEDLVTAADLKRKREKTEDKMARLKAEKQRLGRPVEPLQGIAGKPDAAEILAACTLDRQRAVIAALCELTLSPGETRRSLFSADQVGLVWRT